MTEQYVKLSDVLELVKMDERYEWTLSQIKALPLINDPIQVLNEMLDELSYCTTQTNEKSCLQMEPIRHALTKITN